MRPMFLVIQDATRELGGAEKLAAQLGVSPGHVYKYGEDPNESGKDIPVRHLITIVALTANASTKPVLQELCNELLAHFTAPARRRVVSDQAIEDLEYAVKALRDDTSRPVQSITACPECRGKLRLVAQINGVAIFECPSCHGVNGKQAPCGT